MIAQAHPRIHFCTHPNPYTNAHTRILKRGFYYVLLALSLISLAQAQPLSLIHISEPTRLEC